MKDLFNIEGKVAVVVGGGGGIGGAIAKGFAFYGAKVVITGRKMETLEGKAAEIKAETGKDVTCMTCDSTNQDDVRALRDAVVAKFGTVDILVNSQGFNKKFSALESGDHMDEWDGMYATNVRSILLTCTEFGKVMCEKKYGKIINISSIRGSRALKNAGNIGYGSTKGAVDMLTKYLAGEWGQYNVTVNAIGPIVTMTPMMEKVFAENPGNSPAGYFKTVVPMGRMGVPDDNIGPAMFFASDASSFVTGQVIYPDGGLWCVG